MERGIYEYDYKDVYITPPKPNDSQPGAKVGYAAIAVVIMTLKIVCYCLCRCKGRSQRAPQRQVDASVPTQRPLTRLPVPYAIPMPAPPPRPPVSEAQHVPMFASGFPMSSGAGPSLMPMPVMSPPDRQSAPYATPTPGRSSQAPTLSGDGNMFNQPPPSYNSLYSHPPNRSNVPAQKC